MDHLESMYSDHGDPPPLPRSPPPALGLLSTQQWDILAALADTVVAPITPEVRQTPSTRLLEHPLRREIYEATTRRIAQFACTKDDSDQEPIFREYLRESATAEPQFKVAVLRLVQFYLDDEARNGLLLILKALSTRAGASLLTGHATPFDCLPVRTREEILQSWATARLPLFRRLHKSFTSLVKVTWIRTSPSLGRVLGYTRIPIHANSPKTSFPFQFLQIPPSSTDEPEVISADIVIVGSGCGGAVAAKTLAEAGLKVIVVDQSYYWPPKHLPMSEHDAALHLFGNGGSYTADDATITIVSGSTWGGGGVVNWSASLQTQGFVRREWSQKFGLSYFTSSEYQADLDAVCERMGVGTAAIEHNFTNRVLLEGARKQGWSAKVVPQNTGGEAHNCGYCTLGCGEGGKKGPTETFLPDAARAGAIFIEGLEIEEVLFDETAAPGDRTVKGVRGIWTSRDGHCGVASTERTRRKVVLHAPRVICSGGALSTPLLLQRSGIQNPHLGHHLHLHPAAIVGAVWDTEVRPWEGPILTSVVNEFENLDGEGYGVKLEATTMIPSLFLSLFPWRSGAQWKTFAAGMGHMTGYISLARDRYGGVVFPAPSTTSSLSGNKTKIRYKTSSHDQAHILEGVARLAELLYVQGAREIIPAIPRIPPFVRRSSDPEAKVRVEGLRSPSINDVEFQTWLAELRKTGLPAPESMFASAHQMGSCRMSSEKRDGVVDERGRVWGTKGLWICDASVFPSASGVNPMVTVMAISRGVARGICRDAGVLPVNEKL